MFREEYWCTPTNPNFNSENGSSGFETGQQKINAIADDELHNLILNWSREPIILVYKWCQCYHLSCDAIFLPSHKILIQVKEVELYSIQIFVRGGKLNKTENECKKKIICSFTIASNKWMPRDNG